MQPHSIAVRGMTNAYVPVNKKKKVALKIKAEYLDLINKQINVLQAQYPDLSRIEARMLVERIHNKCNKRKQK